VNRKNRDDKCASPNGAGHLSQDQKKQNGSRGVKNNVREMKRARIESIELELEHVRDVLERKPVRGRPVSEGPFDAVQREAGIYFRNFVNVFGIVEIDEGKRRRLPKHEPNNRDKTGADGRDKSTFRKFIAHSAGFDREMAGAGGKDRSLPESE